MKAWKQLFAPFQAEIAQTFHELWGETANNLLMCKKNKSITDLALPPQPPDIPPHILRPPHLYGLASAGFLNLFVKTNTYLTLLMPIGICKY